MTKSVAIELDDFALVIQADDDNPPVVEHGVALVRKKGIIVGNDAAICSRLEPRRLHDRFWQELSNEDLEKPFPSGLTTADLAHAHLDTAWRKAALSTSQCLLAVPGDLGPQMLGLALGVARAAEIPVSGLVDLGLAASVDRGISGQALHLEIFRHRAVATVLEQRGQKLTRKRVLSENSVGLTGLYSIWARWIAEQFVTSTRFDPLDRADREQELWNSLEPWLGEIRRNGGARLSFAAGEFVHAIEVSEQALAEPVRQSYDLLLGLVQRSGLDLSSAQLVLGSKVASLPGLIPQLSRIGMKGPVELPLGAAATAAIRHAGSITSDGEELPLVIELDTGGSWQLPVAKPPSKPREASTGRRPSHIVHDGIAFEIGLGELVIGTGPPAEKMHLALTGETAGVSRSHCTLRRQGEALIVEDHSRYGTFLNDRLLGDPVELVAGDRLRLGSPGIVLQLVVVVNEYGTS